MSLFKNVSIADGANLDAFSRIRVSDPTTLFSVMQQYDNSPIQLEAYTSGTGVAASHDANSRMSLISCTAGTGVSGMQSYQYLPYQPGKSQLIKLTGVFRAGVVGAVVNAGFGDDNNGIFFRQNGTSGLQVVRRSKVTGNVVEEVVSAASWNLLPSFSVNETNSVILIIDLQFLGMGRVRMGFNNNGVIYYVHEFKNANNMAVPYMQTASLPVRWEIIATSTGSTKNTDFKCASVESEGGFIEDYGYSFGTPLVSATSASGAFGAGMTLRPKTTFNLKENRAQLILVDFDIMVTGSNPVFWALTTGSTYSVAPTYADVSTNNSSMEYGTGGTLSTTGLILHSGLINASNQIKGEVSQSLSIRNPISLNKAGAVRDAGTLSVLLWGIGGTSQTYLCINFKEIR